MDNFRGFEDEAAYPAAAEDEPAIERPPEIGVDERRMHVRAYNYWVSLLAGRAYPSIQDIDPHTIEDFGPHSVLLDFSEEPRGSGDRLPRPRAARRMRARRRRSARSAQVPSRSLLSRLTDHYLQIIANCAPIGFEAEFVGQRGHNTLYRGILMPLSSDGESIDFIYGVINWKELADSETADEHRRRGRPRHRRRAGARRSRPARSGPTAPMPISSKPANLPEAAGRRTRRSSLWPEEPGLADRLCAARDGAEQAADAGQRSRAALYRALGQAYDFALAAEAAPDDYAELLDDAGLKAQARAPMTPVVKLVFGAGYDKTRLTEFAAALCLGAARRRRRRRAGRAHRSASGRPQGRSSPPSAPPAGPTPRPDRWAEVRAALARRPPARPRRHRRAGRRTNSSCSSPAATPTASPSSPRSPIRS